VVIANLSDGKTLAFDLSLDEHRKFLARLIRDDSITGLSIHHEGSINSLPAPKRFRSRPVFGFEFLESAERIHCQADGVRISLTRSLTSRHVRCDLVRTGRMRYDPRRG
jgi:hypothetical protein